MILSFNISSTTHVLKKILLLSSLTLYTILLFVYSEVLKDLHGKTFGNCPPILIYHLNLRDLFARVRLKNTQLAYVSRCINYEVQQYNISQFNVSLGKEIIKQIRIFINYMPTNLGEAGRDKGNLYCILMRSK